MRRPVFGGLANPLRLVQDLLHCVVIDEHPDDTSPVVAPGGIGGRTPVAEFIHQPLQFGRAFLDGNR
jgi:hypothetical protein